jgi:hypothetical protein
MEKETGLKWIRRQVFFRWNRRQARDGKGNRLEMEKDTGLRWKRKQA